MHDDDIIPWRYPAKRELQFGEWQRNDILAGIFEPATIDIDLAILLTKAREHSVALVGPAAEELFDPVPEQDLFEALNETLTLWNSPPDWAGDERKCVVLTLSRIWYSAVTGKIAPKDVAADWAMERLPAQYQPVILEARQAYLGQEEDRLASRADQFQTDPSPSNLRAIRCYEKAGFERQGTVTTPDGPAVYMVQTRQAFERTRSDA